MLGMKFTLACPEGYQLDSSWLEQVIQRYPEASIEQTSDVTTAVKTADAIYTDVWTSMGQEEETAIRKKAFADYQVNSELMAEAPEHSRILHCLPAVRGEEITDEVIDSDQRDVIAQAVTACMLRKDCCPLLNRKWVDENIQVIN